MNRDINTRNNLRKKVSSWILGVPHECSLVSRKSKISWNCKNDKGYSTSIFSVYSPIDFKKTSDYFIAPFISNVAEHCHRRVYSFSVSCLILFDECCLVWRRNFCYLPFWLGVSLSKRVRHFCSSITHLYIAKDFRARINACYDQSHHAEDIDTWVQVRRLSRRYRIWSNGWFKTHTVSFRFIKSIYLFNDHLKNLGFLFIGIIIKHACPLLSQ